MTSEKDIVELLARDPSDAGVARACLAADEWTREGRIAELAALATALEAHADPAHVGAWETLADHVEDDLALMPGDAAIDVVLALSLAARTRSVAVPRPPALRVRAFASRLGQGQPPEAFTRALDRAGPEHHELFACWMHEIVLRGTSLVGRSEGFRATLRGLGHPLAALPLALVASEREVPSYMPLYGDKGLSGAIEALTSGVMSTRSLPPPADKSSVEASLVDDPELIARLSSAAAPWAEGKSGKVEAKVFALAPKVERDLLGSWLLRGLPLASIAGATTLECLRAGADGVFGPLFAAAANGGAYSSGLGGAYGRLAAWTSLGALVGVTGDIEAIDMAAARSAFLTFRAAGPWFHDVAWDLGVLALREDGASAAVLAATDAE